MRIKIKKLSPNAVIPFKSHESDFCYDVVAVSEEEIAPNVWKYGLGFALQPDTETLYIDFDEDISIDLRPRSSVWKTGMILSNCTGTVDAGYTGEISAVFYHVLPNMPRYKVGDRVGQIKVGFTLPIRFVEVDDLDDTDRGVDGYGSTGE